MRKIAGIAMMVMFTCSLLAQDKPKDAAKPEPKTGYRLNFVLTELENGKILNAREYLLNVAGPDSGRGSIRTGNRVPIKAAHPDGAPYQYDFGVDIDAYARPAIDNHLPIDLSCNVTSAAAEGQPGELPITRQFRWSSQVVVPLGKKTIVFRSDDPNSKRTMQLEVTAEQIS